MRGSAASYGLTSTSPRLRDVEPRRTRLGGGTGSQGTSSPLQRHNTKATHMKKLIISGMAVAMLALPAMASANVERYQSQTATFTMTQPAQDYKQWNNVWTMAYKVNVNPCDNTFTGNGVQTGHDANGDYTGKWTINGKFNADKTATFEADRQDGLVFHLTNAVMDGKTITDAQHNAAWETHPIEEKLTAPLFSNTSDYKNHGEFVSQSADKNDAAHSCIGMPINSSK